VVEVRGVPTARGRQKPIYSHSDRFNIFGNSGASSPSPSVSNNGMFGLEDSHSQPHPSRQVRSDSAPPGINAIHSPVSLLDSNGFGRISKGKERQFPITELEGISTLSPLTPKLPEEPQTAEGLSSSTQPSARMEAPSSIPTTPEPVSIGNDNRTEREKSPSRKEEAISTKESPRGDEPIQRQEPDPSPTPLLPEAPQSKQTTLNSQAGPSSKPPQKHVPPHFQVLVDTLRQHGGSHLKISLPVLLLNRDQAVYKKAQVSKYTKYIATAVEARLVREVVTREGCHIFLTEEYV